jgi:hypothetical protein
MKTHQNYFTSCFAVAAILIAAVPAEARASDGEVESIEQLGILPNDKAPLLVTEEERNPFSARLEDKVDDMFALSSESQESQIRSVFAQLNVNGVSKAPRGGLRVLLGDLILSEGRELAPVIVGQTERIVVVKITEKEVELAWVDEHTNQLDGRKLSIPIQMAPTVEFELAGQTIPGVPRARGVRSYAEEEVPDQPSASAAKKEIKHAEKIVSNVAPAADAPDARVIKAERE